MLHCDSHVCVLPMRRWAQGLRPPTAMHYLPARGLRKLPACQVKTWLCPLSLRAKAGFDLFHDINGKNRLHLFFFSFSWLCRRLGIELLTMILSSDSDYSDSTHSDFEFEFHVSIFMLLAVSILIHLWTLMIVLLVLSIFDSVQALSEGLSALGLVHFHCFLYFFPSFRLCLHVTLIT